MKSRKRFRLLLSYCHNEAIGPDWETDDAFYIFYLSQTRSRKSFIINCCLGRVSLQPRPRLMLYSDISTSPQPRPSRQSWSPSWCRARTCGHSVYAPRLSLPPTLISLHSGVWGWAGPQPRLKTRPQSGLVTGSLYFMFTLNIYLPCLWWESSSWSLLPLEAGEVGLSVVCTGVFQCRDQQPNWIFRAFA